MERKATPVVALSFIFLKLLHPYPQHFAFIWTGGMMIRSNFECSQGIKLPRHQLVHGTSPSDRLYQFLKWFQDSEVDRLRLASHMLSHRTCLRFSKGTKLFKAHGRHVQGCVSSFSTDAKPAQDFPSQSRIVICGGGSIGTSVAYHLTLKGFSDVTLLEQGSLSCGTSWHAAGLLGRARKGTRATIADYGMKLLKSLEESGHPTGFKQCGSLNLSFSDERTKAMSYDSEMLKTRGIDHEFISAEEISKKHPFINVSDCQGALWVPEDGSGSPTDICNTFAKLAQNKGARIIENCEVNKLETENNRVKTVVTSKGRIDCEYFVLCGGMWSRHFAQKMNPPVHIPAHASQHFYLLTKPIKGVHHMLPVVRDYDSFTYVREWSGGFLFGIFEPNALPEFPDGVPANLRFHLFPENWPHFEPFLQPMMDHFPCLENAEIQQLLNGPESFSPDLNFIIGQPENVKNMFLGAVMTSGGIINGPAVGRLISEMINDEEPFVDYSEFDIKRFSSQQSNKKYLWDRMIDVIGEHYMLGYPMQSQQSTGREGKCSALHPVFKQQHACFQLVNGMETPAYFPEENQALPAPSVMKPNWAEVVKEEYQKCVASCGLTDLSCLYTYFRLSGSNVDEVMDRLCCGEVSKYIGDVSYSWMLNAHGCVLTCHLLKESNDSYILAVPSARSRHFTHWMMKNDESLGTVHIEDLTHNYTTLALTGSQSAEVFETITDSSISDSKFQKVEIGFGVDILAFKPSDGPKSAILMAIPTQYSYTAYSELQKQEKVLDKVGYYAYETMRVADGVPRWGSEISILSYPTHCFSQDMFSVNSSNFIGKDNFSKQIVSEFNKKLIKFEINNLDMNGKEWFWGGEILKNAGKVIGSVSSVMYDYNKDKFVGLAYVTSADTTHSYIEHGGTKYEITIS